MAWISFTQTCPHDEAVCRCSCKKYPPLRTCSRYSCMVNCKCTMASANCRSQSAVPFFGFRFCNKENNRQHGLPISRFGASSASCCLAFCLSLALVKSHPVLKSRGGLCLIPIFFAAAAILGRANTYANLGTIESFFISL